MADYFTSFCCRLDLGAAENVPRALAIAEALKAELESREDIALGFDIEAELRRPGSVRLCDAEGFGEPEHVITFVLRCAEAFSLSGRWGFVWGLWCSSSRTDGFGGGAQVLDLATRRSIAWIDCDRWLEALLDPATDAEAEVVLA